VFHASRWREYRRVFTRTNLHGESCNRDARDIPEETAGSIIYEAIADRRSPADEFDRGGAPPFEALRIQLLGEQRVAS
jgi:hypothetical protein